jgi:hypothetical protein
MVPIDCILTVFKRCSHLPCDLFGPSPRVSSTWNADAKSLFMRKGRHRLHKALSQNGQVHPPFIERDCSSGIHCLSFHSRKAESRHGFYYQWTIRWRTPVSSSRHFYVLVLVWGRCSISVGATSQAFGILEHLTNIHSIPVNYVIQTQKDGINQWLLISGRVSMDSANLMWHNSCITPL